MDRFNRRIVELLNLAEIKVGGNEAHDINVHNQNVYRRILSEGSMGLGESYMEGWWDAKELDQFFYKLLSTDIERKVKSSQYYWSALQSKILNLQNIRRAFQVGEHHYDIGNDLFSKMLDRRMVYTCAYWKNAKDLDKAQENKLDLVCRKIGLKKNQRILDIGCGWGSFIKYASEKYGVSAVGVTVSKEQAEYAQRNCKNLPVEVRLQDYRELNDSFDHIVSLGMFEHVGPKNYRTYMEIAARCLKKDGLFLLHTIGSNYTRHNPDAWINKYIFPNGVLPSLKDISMATENLFVLEDLHSFGSDYDKTLMAWFENFNESWPQLSDKYGSQFYRMWKYYLLSCAGAFRARNIQLWQLVLSKTGVEGGYASVR